MLDFDWTTLLFQIINFLVLLLVLKHFVFRPLDRKLNERGQTISETLQAAQDRETEALRLQREWQERIAAAEKEAEEIVRAAQREAAQVHAALLREARQRLDELTDEMRADLQRQRDEIVAQHFEEILDTVITLAANVVQSVTTRRTHDDLVTNFCASIYQLPQTDVEEYRRLLRGRVPTAFVTTPVALTPEQTQTLTDTLSSLIDRRMELQVTVDPSLVAGIRVRLADKIIDNSVRQQLMRIRDRVRQDFAMHMGATT